MQRALRRIARLRRTGLRRALATVSAAAARPAPLDLVADRPAARRARRGHRPRSPARQRPPPAPGRPLGLGRRDLEAVQHHGHGHQRRLPEATFTWRVAGALRKRLKALGATVRMTRTANSSDLWGPCVDERGGFGAKVHADVEISLRGDGAATRRARLLRHPAGPAHGATPTTSGRPRSVSRPPYTTGCWGPDSTDPRPTAATATTYAETSAR